MGRQDKRQKNGETRHETKKHGQTRRKKKKNGETSRKMKNKWGDKMQDKKMGLPDRDKQVGSNKDASKERDEFGKENLFSCLKLVCPSRC